MSDVGAVTTGALPADASRASQIGDEQSDRFVGSRDYRYPGSPPFRDIDLDRRLFKGRDEEAKKVFHSILSCDLFLLYSLSGMGKSSLLNAGVMHQLRDRRCWPVTVRSQ